MWQVRYMTGALKSLERLNKPVAEQIFRKTQWLATNFDSLIPESLTGSWKGVYKLRVGNYRVLYTLDKPNHKTMIHKIGRRRDIYKSK